MSAVPDELLAEDAAASEGSPERLSAGLLFDTVLLTLWLSGPDVRQLRSSFLTLFRMLLSLTDWRPLHGSFIRQWH